MVRILWEMKQWRFYYYYFSVACPTNPSPQSCRDRFTFCHLQKCSLVLVQRTVPNKYIKWAANSRYTQMTHTHTKIGVFIVSTTKIRGCKHHMIVIQLVLQPFLPLSANSIKKGNKLRSNRQGSFISLQPVFVLHEVGLTYIDQPHCRKKLTLCALWNSAFF